MSVISVNLSQNIGFKKYKNIGDFSGVGHEIWVVLKSKGDVSGSVDMIQEMEHP